MLVPSNNLGLILIAILLVFIIVGGIYWEGRKGK